MNFPKSVKYRLGIKHINFNNLIVGVALAFAILLGGSPGVLLYANDSVEESLTVAQTGRTIKGLVTDVNGEPLIGCNVVVVGSNAGVITDIDGRFTLNVPADAKQIKISYIGYVDQIMTVRILRLY